MGTLVARAALTTNCKLTGDVITTDTTVSFCNVIAEVAVLPAESVIMALTRMLPSACADKSTADSQVPCSETCNVCWMFGVNEEESSTINSTNFPASPTPEINKTGLYWFTTDKSEGEVISTMVNVSLKKST